MPFRQVQPERLSHAVVRQIEELILRGLLRPGERLPSERDLSERLGVSRPSLREAVADLQARGLLSSRAGAGIFVSEALAATFPPALTELFGSHAEAVVDYIAFRRDMEGLAAERAVRNGTDTDLAVIDAVFRRMEAAHRDPDAAREAQLDAEFHLSIIESCHNVVMLHMMRAMFRLLREGVFYNRQVMFGRSVTRDSLLDQHRAINDAIQSRDADAARAATEAHLGYVEEALLAQQKVDAQDALARQRLARERR
ncbi:transcriptional regulator, GntR family [Tranquillimonas rosea]|uniref:Pyruvate dehydrogenase complex repressor n=1 Tax=Tranquillimonas rosea TaxID=641238 RepID=A0A1H9QZL2_9RHOB|nr:FCD domain-containing protein [Tranquillimonas rosea]SER65906.1 transcriptional regulator, GntR family [Tranquillimonas rosea]